MKRALQVIFFSACVVFMTQESDAATITVNAPDIYGRMFVDVVGDLAAGDEKTFIDKVGTPAEPEKVIVTLMSNGGQFYPPSSSATSSASPAWQRTCRQTKRAQVPVRLCGSPAHNVW